MEGVRERRGSEEGEGGGVVGGVCPNRKAYFIFPVLFWHHMFSTPVQTIL